MLFLKTSIYSCVARRTNDGQLQMDMISVNKPLSLEDVTCGKIISQ